MGGRRGTYGPAYEKMMKLLGALEVGTAAWVPPHPVPLAQEIGDWMVTPLFSLAGLALAVLVAVRITGEVSTMVYSPTAGSWMPIGRPSSISTWKCISGSSQ